MVKTKIVYSDKYYIDIGSHVFPTVKYKLIKQKLLRDADIINRIAFVEPEKASMNDILAVHASDYIDKLIFKGLSHEEALRLELPYSKKLVEGTMLCCGGTIFAADIAIEDGLGIHLGGGFHHAFPDHGEGFCVLNDVAVAVKKIMRERRAKRVLIIDCDLHQGNGTAFIFQGSKDVFTFSIHQENNYPFYKPKGSMDIGLKNRTRGKEYIFHLEKNIPKIISDFKPGIIIYLAGADPYEHDQIGNLALTMDDLRERDMFIYTQAKNYQVPIAVMLAGGYAVKQDDTVNIQFNTIKDAVNVFNP